MAGANTKGNKGGLTVIDHPLVEHKITLIRDRRTPTAVFRRLLRETAMLMAYEVLGPDGGGGGALDTRLGAGIARGRAGKKLCFVSVWRAGDGLLQGLIELVPSARVGHIGLYRDHETLMPVTYYCKLPDDIRARTTIVVDPMMATGGSAADAVAKVKSEGARDVRFLALIAAPEGIETFRKAHPDVPVFIGALDERLNEKGYIVPGLGDAGDRLFGTK